MPTVPKPIIMVHKKTRTDVQGMLNEMSSVAGPNGKDFAWKSTMERRQTKNGLEKGIQVWIEDPRDFKTEPTSGVDYESFKLGMKYDEYHGGEELEYNTGVESEPGFEKIKMIPVAHKAPPIPTQTQQNYVSIQDLNRN